jgi:hypothetical protein
MQRASVVSEHLFLFVNRHSLFDYAKEQLGIATNDAVTSDPFSSSRVNNNLGNELHYSGTARVTYRIWGNEFFG